MRKVLHLLTHPGDEWPEQMIALEKALPDTQHEVVDLRGPNPDYRSAVQKIFAADSVQVW
ncbi:hypothetical protein NXS98_04385 [Fontisphaera persica]|jgi:hypothetical protein|uniref:hypothetical protein n=1 Tax=Fontisphaera persica TaxID=2974023 RepID=UPI0024C0D356|nr:hypothetical protein [Fontisphaera persica]WCJ60375.1 hypothetical protein NXS98_04385 [Fontisphaera persica]